MILDIRQKQIYDNIRKQIEDKFNIETFLVSLGDFCVIAFDNLELFFSDEFKEFRRSQDTKNITVIHAKKEKIIEVEFIDKSIKFTYTNYKNKISNRHVIPYEIWFGETEFHPKKQWLLHAFDLDKQEIRNFALNNIIINS